MAFILPGFQSACAYLTFALSSVCNGLAHHGRMDKYCRSQCLPLESHLCRSVMMFDVM